MSHPIPITLGVRAVFFPHNGFSKSVSADDIYAECLAEGDTQTEAARRAGFAGGNETYHTNRLRRLMGGQAE